MATKNLWSALGLALLITTIVILDKGCDEPPCKNICAPYKVNHAIPVVWCSCSDTLPGSP